MKFHIDSLKETEMPLRDLKLLVLAVFALMIAVRPAAAATIFLTPNNVALDTLASGNVYEGLHTLAKGGEDSYNFFVPTAPLGTITATIAFFGNPFQVAWFSGSTNLTGYVSATESSPLLWVLDPAGPYSLKVLNIGEAASANYLVRITTTPLPPALILFGTALAGLTWLGRRRRLAAGH